MAHTHSVASQQTHSMWYTRAVSCRKQPEPNSAPHRGTVFIRALLPPCVLKTVSSPYLHKPYNWRLHPTYANTDTLWVCVRESLCEPATAGHSRTALHFFFFFFYLMGEEKDRGEGGAAQVLQSSCLTSRDLLTNSTCCCLPILLQPPGLLLTGASCEWDAAAFRVDPYMCEINHFTRPNSLSVGGGRERHFYQPSWDALCYFPLTPCRLQLTRFW